MRNLLIFILVVIAVWWVRNALRRMSLRKGRSGGAQKAAAERMLACRHCGVHVPESEGVRYEDAFYCSEAHRKLGSGKP